MNTFTTPPDTLKVYAYLSVWGGPFEVGSNAFLVAKKPGKGGWFSYFVDTKILGDKEDFNGTVENAISEKLYTDVSDKYLTLADSFNFYTLSDGKGFIHSSHDPYVAAVNKFTGKLYFYHYKKSMVWIEGYEDQKRYIMEGSWVPCDQNGILKNKPVEVKKEVKTINSYLDMKTGEVFVSVGKVNVNDIGKTRRQLRVDSDKLVLDFITNHAVYNLDIVIKGQELI